MWDTYRTVCCFRNSEGFDYSAFFKYAELQEYDSATTLELTDVISKVEHARNASKMERNN